jgi:septum formation protein
LLPSFILGSSSPRRKELLIQLGVDFTTVSPNYDETSFDWPHDKYLGVEQLAIAKASSLIKLHPSSIILTADTIVLFQDNVLGKPHSQDQARDHLYRLRGQTHEVLTGVCVHFSSKQCSGYQKSLVKIRNLSNEQIESYIQTSLPYDKSGGYGIHPASGGLIVEAIEGCYYNVMGLPIHLVSELLAFTPINLWKSSFTTT